MISHHREMFPSQIILEEFHGSHHREQLFFGSAVSLLAGIQDFRCVSDDLFNHPTIFLLLMPQNSSHASVTGICGEDKEFISRRIR